MRLVGGGSGAVHIVDLGTPGHSRERGLRDEWDKSLDVTVARGELSGRHLGEVGVYP